jgi:hypothetical protein
MITENSPVSAPDLEEVEQLFKSWRKTRKHHKPIPTELWKAAVSLTGTHSIRAISKRLLLNPTELERRVHASCTHPPVKVHDSAVFVEFPLGAPQTQNCKCIIEMEDQSGAKMKIEVNDTLGVDLQSICKAFWSRGA